MTTYSTTYSKTRTPFHWPAGIAAGLIAGLVFLLLEMTLVPLVLGGSPWAPPRMIGAIVLGQDVLPPPATFDLAVVVVAMITHAALSVVYGLALAWFAHHASRGAALGIGAVFGLGLYMVNFYVMTALFPWFALGRNWVSLLSHVVFGVVVALVYKKMAVRQPAPQPSVLA